MCAFLLLEPRLLSVPWTDLLIQLLAQGIFVAILGLYFYAESARRLGAPKAAIFGSLTPVLTVMLSAPLLAETPPALTLAGVVLVTAGVFVVLMGSRST